MRLDRQPQIELHFLAPEAAVSSQQANVAGDVCLWGYDSQYPDERVLAVSTGHKAAGAPVTGERPSPASIRAMTHRPRHRAAADEPLFPLVAPGDDAELDAVEAELNRLDPTGDRFALVLRDSLDQLLDGRRRGRWNYADLLKTEKTHMGTVVEINLGREFEWDAADADPTDYRIAGVLVDCKFSGTGVWNIGPELRGLLCLVVQANDHLSSWRAGLVRAEERFFNLGRTRDSKASLNAEGRARIRWLWQDHPGLEENLLLHLDLVVRGRIFSAAGARGPSGQARLNQLCREVQGRILTRGVVETVGHGLDDPLRRMRGNPGARTWLRPEGIIVLGHSDEDPRIARAFGLSAPVKGQFIALRVVPAAATEPAVQIDGRGWRPAASSDPLVPGPALPRGRERS